MKKFLSISLSLISTVVMFSQPNPTDAESIIKAYKDKEILVQSSRVKNIEFKNIGPTIMSGRVVALEVNPQDPTKFYVAYASGGVWYTDNNGTSFQSISDEWPTQNIGEIAIDWKNGVLWVGTGENNSSRSSYSGIGILKTNADGSNWKNVGLHDSHHIGKILINPENSDHVVIGVTGHLYSNNINRGVYVTKDGGENWNKTLYINDLSGIIDMSYTPGNFNVMYASSWEKDRKAWNFDEDGNSSGIYKSIDGGDNWSLISNDESGFPTGTGIGRIGLAVFDSDIVYAVLDNQNFREPTKKVQQGLTKESFIGMTIEKFNKIGVDDLKTFLRTNRFPPKYKPELIKKDINSRLLTGHFMANWRDYMKKVLLGSTAIVAAGMIASAPSAIAAEKMKLSVGGYMEQWFGFTSQDDATGQDYSGFSTVSDGEIHFKGSTKLDNDNGIKIGVNVQLEAQQGGDQIDEQYMTVSGGFGQIIIGDENSALYKMHYAPNDFGIGISSGLNFLS